jgi:hypothetical protein
MRSHPGSFQLTFLLPDGAAAVPGFHQPSPEGCSLAIAWPLVTIAGPSRRAVFDHATRLLRASCRHLPAASIAARLTTLGRPAGSDAWSIAINADVSFSPTGLDAEFPGQLAQPPPLRLEVIDGGRST